MILRLICGIITVEPSVLGLVTAPVSARREFTGPVTVSTEVWNLDVHAEVRKASLNRLKL